MGWLIAAGVLAAGFLSRDTLLSREAPPFSLPETYGGRVNLSSYKGRPVLLVFWTTTCGICRYQLPLLNRMAPEFRGRGIEVISIQSRRQSGGARLPARDSHRADRPRG